MIKRFVSIYEVCHKDIYKFFLLLRKTMDPYQCVDSWERFHETPLPNREAFYSSLNMENIRDVDYRLKEYIKTLIIKI